METISTLPAPIEKQLQDLDARHKAHQRMLYSHHEAKHDRREKHRAHRFDRKVIPIHLV
jgi:hypothetical protein